jgi:hypothetical protein
MNKNPTIPQQNRATIIANTISVLCILLHFGFSTLLIFLEVKTNNIYT